MKRYLPIFGAVLAALLVAVLTFWFAGPRVSEYMPEGPIKNLLFKSPWSGETPSLYPPLAVMIENELLSRPWQIGLGQADIVYEAPAEFGITRFLAVFLDEKYKGKMGPVRSARSYFLDWAHEYNALYAHVGGRFDALARLRKEDIFDADQFFEDPYFWRENVGKTLLEHTMFTTGAKLTELAAAKNWLWEKPDGFGKPAGATQKNNWDALPQAAKIFIDFGHPTYRVDWEYNDAAKVWARLQTKKPHMDDETGNVISAKTVVIQTVNAWSNNDAAASISMKTSGEGPAAIFYKGRMLEGRWRKEMDVKSPTRFFTKEGQEVMLPEKPVWIEVVPEYNSWKME